MKIKRAVILSFVLFGMFSRQPDFGQIVQSPADEAARQQQLIQEQTQARNRRNGYNDKGFMTDLGPPVPPALYKGKAKEMANLRKAFERTKHLLVVPEIYSEKYKFLLKDKKVKLARLQSDKNCYSENVVSAADLERCAEVVPIPGGGSSYSFETGFHYLAGFDAGYQLESNVEGDWWNIHFLNGKFIVQNDSVRGIISEIGDVDLKDINLASRELEFLNNFKQKKTLPEVKEQSDSLRNGISFNNFIYSNSSRVNLNSSYVLRSINYRSMREMKYIKLRKRADKRADITVAFKVVGQESDGSVIILWKELKAGRLPE